MEQKITLYFNQGSSDKVYKAALEEKDGLYFVNFAYGRRGNTLKTGTKTQTGVELEKAQKIFDKLVNGKMAKGYEKSESESNANYVYESDKIQTGIHCQLLNPIEENTLQEKLKDDKWVLQAKMDGKRLLIQKKGKEITFINRKGFSVGAPDLFLNWANSISFDFLIDGEAIGEEFYAFDLWQYDSNDLKALSYAERLPFLQKMDWNKNIHLVTTAFSSSEKENLYQQLKEKHAEGLVLKHLDAPITPGRPNSGGHQLKFKFYETASFVVHKINDKRSVGIQVFENGKPIDVGNVTIPPNKEIPALHDIIEIRYLYAFKGGSVYQPTFLNGRDDLNPEECSLEQLKFKPE